MTSCSRGSARDGDERVSAGLQETGQSLHVRLVLMRPSRGGGRGGECEDGVLATMCYGRVSLNSETEVARSESRHCR